MDTVLKLSVQEAYEHYLKVTNDPQAAATLTQAYIISLWGRVIDKDLIKLNSHLKAMEPVDVY